MKKQIIISLSTKDTQIETKGFEGKACLSQMQDINKELQAMGLDLKLDAMISTNFETVETKQALKE